MFHSNFLAKERKKRWYTNKTFSGEDGFFYFTYQETIPGKWLRPIWMISRQIEISIFQQILWQASTTWNKTSNWLRYWQEKYSRHYLSTHIEIRTRRNWSSHQKMSCKPLQCTATHLYRFLSQNEIILPSYWFSFYFRIRISEFKSLSVSIHNW